MVTLILASLTFTASTSRQSVSLEGEWDFTLIEPAAAGPGFSNLNGTILIPGSWQAQGCGVSPKSP